MLVRCHCHELHRSSTERHVYVWSTVRSKGRDKNSPSLLLQLYNFIISCYLTYHNAFPSSSNLTIYLRVHKFLLSTHSSAPLTLNVSPGTDRKIVDRAHPSARSKYSSPHFLCTVWGCFCQLKLLKISPSKTPTFMEMKQRYSWKSETASHQCRSLCYDYETACMHALLEQKKQSSSTNA